MMFLKDFSVDSFSYVNISHVIKQLSILHGLRLIVSAAQHSSDLYIL